MRNLSKTIKRLIKTANNGEPVGANGGYHLPNSFDNIFAPRGKAPAVFAFNNISVSLVEAEEASHRSMVRCCKRKHIHTEEADDRCVYVCVCGGWHQTFNFRQSGIFKLASPPGGRQFHNHKASNISLERGGK